MDLKDNKLQAALIAHVYNQKLIGLIASLLCASIVFVGLLKPSLESSLLLIWAILFLAITLVRFFVYFSYKKSNKTNLIFWKLLYIVGACLGGASWGFMAFFLLPIGTSDQQMLMILMLAGVTAGAVPLSAALPGAAIGFLTFSLLPLIASLLLLKSTTSVLFDVAVLIYFLYTIVLTFKIYQLIKKSIQLQFEKADLLDKLFITNAKLKDAATHDPLTHVANRTLFFSKLEEGIREARSSNTMLALFYLDLDNFKILNDKYGHHIGDNVLKVVMNRLISFFRKDDVVARLGGDEIAIIIDHVHDYNEISSIAKKICHLMAIPVETNQITIHVTVSIGISVYPHHGEDKDSLIQHADRSMYHAKNHGGNQYYFFKEV